VKTSDIHRGALPFMALQTVGLLIVMFVPETVTWLVDRFFGDDNASALISMIPL